MIEVSPDTSPCGQVHLLPPRLANGSSPTSELLVQGSIHARFAKRTLRSKLLVSSIWYGRSRSNPAARSRTGGEAYASYVSQMTYMESIAYVNSNSTRQPLFGAWRLVRPLASLIEVVLWRWVLRQRQRVHPLCLQPTRCSPLSATRAHHQNQFAPSDRLQRYRTSCEMSASSCCGISIHRRF